MAEAKTIDLTFLMSFTSGDKAKMEKYINMFLTHAPVQLQAIKKHLEEKNWNDLKLSAHSLKPQLMYMGIESSEEVVLKIENIASSRQRLDRLPELIHKLVKICETAMAELRAQSSVNNHF